MGHPNPGSSAANDLEMSAMASGLLRPVALLALLAFSSAVDCDTMQGMSEVEVDLHGKALKFVGVRPNIKKVAVPPNRRPKMKITAYSRSPQIEEVNNEVYTVFGPGAQPLESTVTYLGDGIPSTPTAPFTATEVPNLHTDTYGDTSVPVRINEVISNDVVDPVTGQDRTDFNGYPAEDSVELYNPSNSAVDLTGFYLMDSGADNAAQWIESAYMLPDGTTIAPWGFLVLQNKANFSWGIGSAENLRLFKLRSIGASPNAVQDSLIDFFDYSSDSMRGHQLPGGRCPDGSDNWINPMRAPTLGMPNECSYPVVVNEVLSSDISDTWGLPDVDDYVELYNRGSVKFDLGGCYMIDNADDHEAMVFPRPTILKPNGFLAFVSDAPGSFTWGIGRNDHIRIFAPRNPASPDPAIDSLLFEIDLTDELIFVDHQRSGGRCPDGAPSWVGGQTSDTLSYLLTSGNETIGVPGGAAVLSAPYQLYPSPGKSNCNGTIGNVSWALRAKVLCEANRLLAAGSDNAPEPPVPDTGCPVKDNEMSLLNGVVKITELDHSGVPSDWVELYNDGSNTVDLSGWIFKDNDDTHCAVLPAGTSIAAGAYFVFDRESFDFGLGGSADAARLWDADGKVVDAFAWTAGAPAPQSHAVCDGQWTLSVCKTKGQVNSCPGAEQPCAGVPIDAPCDACEAFPATAPTTTRVQPPVNGVAFEVSGGAWHPRLQKMVLVGDPGYLWIGDANGVGQVYLVAGDTEGVALADPASELLYLIDEDTAEILEWSMATEAVTRRFDLLAAAAAQGVAALTAEDKDALVDAGAFNVGGDGDGAEGLVFVPDASDAEGGIFWVGSQENAKLYQFRLSLKSGGTSVTFMGSLDPWPGSRDLSSLEYDWECGVVLAMFDGAKTLRVVDSTGAVLEEFDSMPGADVEAVVYSRTSQSLWMGQDASNEVNLFQPVAFAGCPATTSPSPTALPAAASTTPPPIATPTCTEVSDAAEMVLELSGAATKVSFHGLEPRVTVVRVAPNKPRRAIVMGYSTVPSLLSSSVALNVFTGKCPGPNVEPQEPVLAADGNFQVELESNTKVLFEPGTFGGSGANGVTIVAFEEVLDISLTPLPSGSATALGSKVLRFFASRPPVRAVKFVLSKLIPSPGSRRAQTAFPIMHWLNEQTKEWQVVCGTTETAEGDVQADLAPAILAHPWFDADSGCDASLACTAGDGGRIAAFYIDDSVCAPASSDFPQSVVDPVEEDDGGTDPGDIGAITIGVVVGVFGLGMLLLSGFFTCKEARTFTPTDKTAQSRDVAVPVASKVQDTESQLQVAVEQPFAPPPAPKPPVVSTNLNPMPPLLGSMPPMSVPPTMGLVPPQSGFGGAYGQPRMMPGGGFSGFPQYYCGTA